MIKKREEISFYTHFAAAIASIVGTIVLLVHSDGGIKLKLVSIIYGLSIIFLFFASSMYHMSKKSDNDVSIWRKIDHFAIFVMIAGTYTPICYFYLEGTWFYLILSIQWGLVLIGGILKFLFINSSRFWSTLVYCGMGWLAIFPVKELISTMPLSQFLLIIAGGISFTLGAVLYALKKPVLIHEYFGFHEIFHILTVLGAGFHYTVVYRAI